MQAENAGKSRRALPASLLAFFKRMFYSKATVKNDVFHMTLVGKHQ